MEQLRIVVARGRRFGGVLWTEWTIDSPGLESSVRPRGSPRKVKDGMKGPEMKSKPVLSSEAESGGVINVIGKPVSWLQSEKKLHFL
jgi:hypothetical protein